jgi:hypothetical protein
MPIFVSWANLLSNHMAIEINLFPKI